MRNNYDKQVFNGSVGVVTAISLEEQETARAHGRGGGDRLRLR